MEDTNAPLHTEQTTQTVSARRASNPSKTFLILIVVILLAGMGFVGYMLGMNGAQPVPEPQVPPMVARPTTALSTPTPTIQISSSPTPTTTPVPTPTPTPTVKITPTPTLISIPTPTI